MFGFSGYASFSFAPGVAAPTPAPAPVPTPVQALPDNKAASGGALPPEGLELHPAIVQRVVRTE
jgi:hypothetical protein